MNKDTDEVQQQATPDHQRILFPKKARPISNAGLGNLANPK
jgi:hypothetical protein